MLGTQFKASRHVSRITNSIALQRDTSATSLPTSHDSITDRWRASHVSYYYAGFRQESDRDRLSQLGGQHQADLRRLPIARQVIHIVGCNCIVICRAPSRIDRSPCTSEQNKSAQVFSAKPDPSTAFGEAMRSAGSRKLSARPTQIVCSPQA